MTFVWTDNPADPCAYDVQWDEPEDMNSANFEEALPVWPDGSVAPRLYRFAHDDCEKAVIAYTIEAALEVPAPSSMTGGVQSEKEPK